MELNPSALYRCLSEDLESQLGDLTPLCGAGLYPVGVSVKKYAALSLSNSFLKKFSEGAEADAEKRAYSKFLASNDSCKRWTLLPNTSADEELLGCVKHVVWDFFEGQRGPLDLGPSAVFADGDLGPGTSVRAAAQDFYTKLFAGPLSSTSTSLYVWYSRMIQRYPAWSAAEKQRISMFGIPLILKGNRLSFVPKTTKVARTICAEPTLNMWFQLGCYRVLARRLRTRFGIDLRDQQEKNQRLARLGSEYGTYGTIDLESASDTISTSMLEWLLPREVFRDLSRYRSPSTTLPDSSELALSMFSSMGNGFTFPLQTVIFSCVVCAVYWYLNIPYEVGDEEKPGASRMNYGVFGDDIICVTESYDLISRLLHLLGFTVNKHKSFNNGPFRESCGADYYHGSNVRGVYLKSSQRPSLFAAINQLNMFTARTGVRVPLTSEFLRRHVPWTPVPLWEADDAGIRTPISFFTPRLDENGSYAYYAWKPDLKKLRIEDERIKVPKGEKKRFFNPDGLYCTFLAGRLSSMSISIRHDRVRYKRKLSVAPNWSYTSSEVMETSAAKAAGEWKRCESAFYLNL